NSHVVRGSLSESKLVEARTILFKETAAHSSFDWHNDPIGPDHGSISFTTFEQPSRNLRPGRCGRLANIGEVQYGCRLGPHLQAQLRIGDQRLSIRGNHLLQL